MSTSNTSIRQALYEDPGPRAKKIIAVITTLSVAALVALGVAILHRFVMTGQFDERYWSFFTRPTTWRFLGQGLAGTLSASTVAMLLAFLVGFLLMRGKMSPLAPLRRLCAALVEFSRGVPTLLFIYFFFLVAPQLGLSLRAFWKITLPVALSAAGIVAETLRSGVNAVPKGQWEAATALGFRKRSQFYLIIFPQALRYVVPSMISELVIVLKDTTFAYVVSYPDLMQNAKVLISNYDAMLSVYLVVAVIYILINYLLNRLATRFARRNSSRNGGAALAPSANY
ncbi:MAG: amino acid ABC transporter permease [Christensenellales bacterium]|nr:amino acid ABC transporter permease [Christensenellales bacterium]